MEPEPAIPEAPAANVEPTDMIVTPEGTEVGVTYEVKELGDLIASQTDNLQDNPNLFHPVQYMLQLYCHV